MTELPASPTVKMGDKTDPARLNPELANLDFAKELVRQLGTPSDVTKRLVVRKAIYEALNHRPPTYKRLLDASGKPTLDQDGHEIWIVKDPGNPTGYDCSLRLAVYEAMERGSVNVDGKYFNSIMTFLNKPKVVVTGIPTGGAFANDDEPGFIGRIINRLTGKSSDKNGGSS